MVQLTQQDKKWLKIAGVAVALYLIYKIATPKTDNSGNAADPTGNSGNNPAAANFNAAAVADTLHNAMKDIGTDEEAILNATQYLNAQQFAQVIAAFDKRPYNSTWGNDMEPWFGSLPKLTLPQWLKKELSSSLYNQIRLKFPLLL